MLPMNVQGEQTPQNGFLSLNHCPGISPVYQVSGTLMCSNQWQNYSGKRQIWLAKEAHLTLSPKAQDNLTVLHLSCVAHC